jgi:hypothetical protein
VGLDVVGDFPKFGLIKASAWFGVGLAISSSGISWIHAIGFGTGVLTATAVLMLMLTFGSGNQYSSGESRVVTERSASVITQSRSPAAVV